MEMMPYMTCVLVSGGVMLSYCNTALMHTTFTTKILNQCQKSILRDNDNDILYFIEACERKVY